jgi:hypothetical protein
MATAAVAPAGLAATSSAATSSAATSSAATSSAATRHTVSAVTCKPGPQPSKAGASSGLNGVGVVSSCSAWAVGFRTVGTVQRTLIEYWNGKHWSPVKSPNPGTGTSSDVLTAVTVISKKDAWAVGDVMNANKVYWSTLILHWNGKTWKTVPSPNPGGPFATNALTAISAVSATDIWAAGFVIFGEYKTAILHWTGTKWKTVATPNKSGASNGSILHAIAATSRSQAWASGYACSTSACQPVLLRWNGKKWSLTASASVPGMLDGYLYGLSAPSKNSAWVVGWVTTSKGDSALVEHWNGHKWVRKPVQVPALGASYLYAVRTFSADSAVAVGYSQNGLEAPLIETWNGVKWSMVHGIIDPFGSSLDYNLYAVGGTACSNAWAVGSAFVSTTARRPVVLRC